MVKCILSVTSYGKRLLHLHEAIGQLVDMPDYRIIVTLYKPDTKLLTPEMQSLIDSDMVGLLLTDIDYKSHKKYIKVFERFFDVPVITIDDDVFYTREHIELLYEAYTKHSNCVCATRVRVISLDKDGRLKPYSKFREYEGRELPASQYNMAVGVGGVIYPSHSLPVDKRLALSTPCDDTLLKIFELRNGINVCGVKTYEPLQHMKYQEVRKTALYPRGIGERDKMWRDFYDELKILERSDI